jgi:hypothetical protein
MAEVGGSCELRSQDQARHHSKTPCQKQSIKTKQLNMAEYITTNTFYEAVFLDHTLRKLSESYMYAVKISPRIYY